MVLVLEVDRRPCPHVNKNMQSETMKTGEARMSASASALELASRLAAMLK